MSIPANLGTPGARNSRYATNAGPAITDIIHTPVLPGILPVTSLSTMGRLGAMGAAAPAWMEERLRAADEQGGADAVRKEGVELATELCARLLEVGVPGLHFYTFNTSSATREIYAALGLGPSAGS